MSHRDAASIPLVVGALTSDAWIPFGLSWSQLGTGIMWAAGLVLIVVQIRYYWTNTHQK